MANLIGDKTYQQWMDDIQQAGAGGDVNAEVAARQAYANAFNGQYSPNSAPTTAADIQNPTSSFLGNMDWGQGASAGGGAGYSGGSPGAYNTKPMQGSPGGFSGGTSSASTAGQNPYLTQMGNTMVGQMTDNFNRRVMPSIASGAMASGGFGGSRQGVVEANAMNDLNTQIGGALSNLYGNGFNTALNYDLGLRGNDLGYAGLDAQINQNNFNNRLAGANFGLGVVNQGMANNQAGINAGTNVQNTPMNYWSQFANQYNGIGQGYGSTTGSTSQQGNPVMGALGGAQLGGRIASMWGSSPNAAGGANSQGWGTGSGYGNMDLGGFL